jgi:hypothetical protein
MTTALPKLQPDSIPSRQANPRELLHKLLRGDKLCGDDIGGLRQASALVQQKPFPSVTTTNASSAMTKAP